MEEPSHTTQQPYIVNAYLETDTTILVKLSQSLNLPINLTTVVVTDLTASLSLPITLFNTAYASPFTPSAGLSTDLLQVTLGIAPDITHQLEIALDGYRPRTILPRLVLNSARYTYTGDDLGNIFSSQETAFRVWAPTATAVDVLLYKSETSALTTALPMQRSDQGTWYICAPMNLENWYYLYQVTIGDEIHTAVDPYARALAVNATRAMLVDLHNTNPANWEADQHKKLANPADAVLYELHIRDFSTAANSGMTHKGQYLAFTERGTTGPENVATGIESLKQLGISHVQLLPVYDFASIDETRSDQYNWGYDPRCYNVPQGAYATSPHGTKRIIEYKQLIQSLHSSHIGVVMDVVYNHTFSTRNSDFDKLVPQYYYRTDYSGNYTNGSGCGNEVAAERPMVQKFIRDSLKYWVKEYHVDGFRFDLMALLGIETMRLIVQDLRAINPDILLYGEPWPGGDSALPSEQLLYKGRQKDLGIAVFNDTIRNALDGNVFYAQERGFATGAMGQVDIVKRALLGSLHEFTATPGETINYVTSHDNRTLWDKIAVSNAEDSESNRIKMAELAFAVIITSQGIPFIQGGEEILRTKGGSDNSYNAGDAVNQFDWSRKAHYLAVFQYYVGLIHLRNHHPAFRLPSANAVNQHISFLSSPTNTIAFTIQGHANGDSWQSILVIHNPNTFAIQLDLPPGNWTIVATQDLVNEDGLGRVAGSVSVDEISCMILYQA